MNLRTCIYQDVPPIGETTLLNRWDKIGQHDRRVERLCCWSHYHTWRGVHLTEKPHLKSWKNRKDLTRDWKNKGERDRVDVSAKNRILQRHRASPSLYTFRLLCSLV